MSLVRTSGCKSMAFWLLVVMALLAAGCAGGGDAETLSNDVNIVDAGSIKVDLPTEVVAVEEEPTVAPAATATTGTEVADKAETAEAEAEPTVEPVATEPTEDPDAIPLAEQETSVSDLINTFDDFSTCLDADNFPIDLLPAGPADAEGLAKLSPEQTSTLFACASSSGILQSLQDLEASAADRTAAEIESDNEASLYFVDCMRGKGWDVADPAPDRDGALLLNPADFTPPAGEDLFDNPSLRECGREYDRVARESREALES